MVCGINIAVLVAVGVAINGGFPLFLRGFQIEGKALAEHVRAVIGPVAKAQRDGKIGDFWPYFCAAVRRYVGAHAEEIQAYARQTGADAGEVSFGGRWRVWV